MTQPKDGESHVENSKSDDKVMPVAPSQISCLTSRAIEAGATCGPGSMAGAQWPVPMLQPVKADVVYLNFSPHASQNNLYQTESQTRT